VLTLTNIISVLSGGLAGAFITLGGQAIIRFRNRPRPVVVFSEGEPGCVITTPGYLVDPQGNTINDEQGNPRTVQQKYLRLKIKNIGRTFAQNTSVFITEISYRAEGAQTRTFSEEVLELKLALAGDKSVFNLAAGGHRYVDVVHTQQGPGQAAVALIFDFVRGAVRLNLMGYGPGQYEMTIFVAAENCQSVRRIIRWSWNGTLNGLVIHPMSEPQQTNPSEPPVWRFLKAIDANQWIAIGTWVLALGTVGIFIDAKFSSERTLRAYVFAAPGRAYNIDTSGTPAQVYTIIGSKGSTFAQNVERRVGINLLPSPVPNNFADLGPLKREEGVLVLAPGANSVVVQNFRPLTAEELAKIMTPNGDLRIYAFGKITYDDAFGWSHQTTFCHAYFGRERLPFNGGFAYDDWQAKSCDRHNSAD
jgi:hypothetical protein